ncbi:alpha-hydroxy acid oxidase [Yinghuangia seranimata]|nr:alpha-hydroxy acid oxidase [Yinghuangia seranimata]
MLDRFGEEAARDALPPATHAYISGGSGDEVTLRANVEAWRGLALRPHVLRDVADMDLRTELLGVPVAAPVAIAPTAMHQLVHPDGELATARAAGDAGLLLAVSMFANHSYADVARAAEGTPSWAQMYLFRDHGLSRELAEKAGESGARAVVVCVDGAAVPRRSRFAKGAFAPPDDLRFPNLAHVGGLTTAITGFDRGMTFDDIGRFAEWSGLPVVVKGVLRGDDAARCVAAGAAAIAVSNHGGRQFDGCAATAGVLAEVVDAVAGRAEVYVDGGIRNGADVVKALALGARAAFVGRPVLWALAAGGVPGAAEYLRELVADVTRVLAFTGCRTPHEATRDLVRAGP